MVLETEVMSGHYVARLAVDGLRAWYIILSVFYHNRDSPSVISRFKTSELQHVTKTGAKVAEAPRAESCHELPPWDSASEVPK